MHASTDSRSNTGGDILFNNRPVALQGDESVAHFLRSQSGVAPCFVLMLNGSFLPKEEWEQTPLKDGDRIELVVPVAGG